MSPKTVAAFIASLLLTLPHLDADDWPTAPPSAVNLDPTRLAALLGTLRNDPHRDLKGVVVVRHAKIAVEWYFNGDTRTSLHDIRSATKSITALLMGIAIDRHLVASVDDSIANYLPGLPQDGKQHIRIRDLLTMRSGLDADDADPTSPGNETRLDASEDWIKSVFVVPVKEPPGQKYNYCSLNAFLAGAIIENASRLPLDQFAAQYLFQPLGIGDFHWRHVPIDRVTGQGNLDITTRDEALIGWLVLKKGTWHRRQVISPDWIAQCLSSYVPISAVDPYADSYGYMWYTRQEPAEAGRVLVYFASGNGGNKIYVVPSKDMVIGITSSAYGQRYGQTRSQDILLKILAASR